jgi:DNA-binding NtrC family response regulator
MTTLLLVDDDDTYRGLLAMQLRESGYHVVHAGSVREAKRRAAERPFDLALVDLALPDGSGLDVLECLRDTSPRTEALMLTGHGTIDTAVEAMRLGAFDYLRKPCPMEELEVTLERALERQQLKEKNAILEDGYAARDLGAHFVGCSRGHREVTERIGRVAPTDSTVLILGETGVGKEVVSRELHARSGRRERPFVVVECACLHHDLLHSELFGHEKGAFTGAHSAKHGLFEVADGGTLFLDEIGDVSPDTQTKLLRVLETGCFRHAGGLREIKVDVRILAATNRDLEELMGRGYFRRDLYYRLSTITIRVPPLRDRREDIPVLLEAFLARTNAKLGQRKRLTPAAVERLYAHPWPGNVRELLHVIEGAVILSSGDVIDAPDLPLDEPASRASGADAGATLTLAELEERHIRRVLTEVAGNRSQAAQRLGISERTLYRKIVTLGLAD